MSITRIVSGGQTGADRGGLEAALYCDLPHGGWCPKGRKADDGIIPAKFDGFRETDSAEYPPRTESNVVDSDATLVFCYGEPTGGSKLTVALASKHKRPCCVIDLNQPRPEAVSKAVEWLKRECPARCVLNIAGSRETTSPGIGEAVMVRMVDIISGANGKLFYPIK